MEEEKTNRFFSEMMERLEREEIRNSRTSAKGEVKIGATARIARGAMFHKDAVKMLNEAIIRNLCRKLADGVQFGKTYVLKVGISAAAERVNSDSAEFEGEMRLVEIPEDAVEVLKEMGLM